MSLKIWNRASGRIEEELIFGESAMRWLYENRIGQNLAQQILSRAWLSQLYGSYQNTSYSARGVPDFIRKFGIKVEEYEDRNYSSFNDFFIRKFKPGMRPIEAASEVMPAFAEGRYLAFEKTSLNSELPVKGAILNAGALLGSRPELAHFIGGPAFIARLCPVDYHRYHYPDDGKTLESFRLSGKLHSVNPIAFSYRGDILFTNERTVSILDTENFGKLAYIEVGAMCVGKIVQTHPAEKNFRRGDEKGYFLFGGSTVILLGEAGKWKPDSEILKQSLVGRETLVRLGEKIAQAQVQHGIS
ncbi:MAG: phosphatidylserine decarboxylase [Methylotenera sp.]|nr:phosphatidylserine decarboxylase [Oligoflexia bacterium]